MAFDGITIANVVKEMQDSLMGGRICKIAQPEPDELLLTIKGTEGQRRLLISAGASLPLIYLTENNKPGPLTAPNFCMLLRKHLQNGRITAISQPGLERIITITVEHLNEMGDLCQKRLVVEIMGKHSNIIFCDDQDMVIDSIKHVSGLVSSVREVLPGKPYFIADTTHKKNPLKTSEAEFTQMLAQAPMPVFKALYTSYTGISPIMAQELCYRAGLDGEQPTAAFSTADYKKLYDVWDSMMEDVKAGRFSPAIAYTKGKPAEFAAFPLTMYGETENPDRRKESGEPGLTAEKKRRDGDYLRPFASMSGLLESYYAEKNAVTRIRQKSVDLRKIVQNALERNVKKYDLQLEQMKDTQKRDIYRIYGELINTYGYGVEEGAKSLEALNYYTDERITIPLDPQLTPGENAKKYFDKYGKMKRTYEALAELTKEVKAEIEHLQSISTALDIAVGEEDLVQIKEELIENGYIRRKGGGKKVKITSKPFHYISSDGYDMYVGKNNFQNDELTFKFAAGNDWWFHAKGCPGSHVVVRTGSGEMPDTTFEEAARLAAYYSAGRDKGKAEVDYIQKKHVKKPNGAKPGFVVYYTNFSMVIDADISGIREAQ